MADNDEEIEVDFNQFVLEPVPVELPGVGTELFEGASAALSLAKLSACEAILSLIGKDLKFNDFMRELLMIFMKTVRSEAGSIFELDHENGIFFFRAIVGTSSDRLDQFTVPRGKGIVGHVAESRQPLVAANVGEDQVHLKSIGDAVGFEAKNLVALPLIIRGNVYGVVELLNRTGQDTYTPDDIELLTYICENAAKAIEIRLMLAWALQSRQAA